MPQFDRVHLRAAISIAAHMSMPRSDDPFPQLPESAWQRCQRLVRQIRRARLRGWLLAERSLRTELLHALACVEQDTANLREQLPSTIMNVRGTRLHDLYWDLQGLQEEFPAVAVDLSSRLLSVTTEPITLQGVYLGAFEIQLDWSHKHGRTTPPFRVIARDPHPPENRENVTHPHVMDGVLCEGDGRYAIRRALSEARLSDFFLLVAAVLRNYNPESPFVELAVWYGIDCADCGSIVDGDDRYCCQRCDATLCVDCERSCGQCSECYCANCSGPCSTCHDDCCERCVKRCAECRQRVCTSCLDDDERCPNCHEEESCEEAELPSSEACQATLQSDSLGQAASPA